MQKVLQHFFRKNTLQEITVESLRQFTKQYPYFAAGHYFLARKLHEINDVAFPEQVQKTLIYFHNPLWLQYQLQETKTHETAGKTLPLPLAAREAQTGTSPALSAKQAWTDDGTGLETDEAEKEFEKANPLVIKTLLPEAALPAVETRKDKNTAVKSDEPAKTVATELPAREQTVQQEEPFAFQSYHTIDYFASQGIKLSQEVKPEDKLGRQLKSFTEWLKIMRRLPQPDAEEVTEKADDETIEQFAAHSLEEKEVVTEAMAEVLMKQGKHEKARQVYRKLSLLNPQKSAYFAAKSNF